MKKFLLMLTMLFMYGVTHSQCTIWSSTPSGSKNDRLYILDGTTLWSSTPSGSKDDRLYIIDGNTLWTSTPSGSKNQRILIAEGGCMGKISVLSCLLARL